MRVPSLVRDERGVTGAIVAISLVVILGMLALGVDMGFMFAKRRSLVNANDSAALAFAQSCALRHGEDEANAQALTLAKRNAANAEPAEPPQIVSGACGTGGEVRVHYQGEQSLFFSPIVGLDSSVTVSAKAHAIWGPAGGAGNVLPLMMSMGRLTDCDIPNAVPGTTCYFYVNNKDVGDAEWGLLNVQPDPAEPKFGWDVEDVNYNCPSFSAEELRDIIENGSPDNLAIDFPEPTYVCRVPGVKAADFMAVELLEGSVRMFPVNDPNGQILRGGTPAPPPMTPDFYDIVGFAQLLIENVMRGNDADWDPNCPGAADANAFCLKVVWQGYSTSPGPPCVECPDFGVYSIGLKG